MTGSLTADRVAGLVSVFGFSVGLGVGTVTIPLLALASGYDAATVGFLVATSAASQLGTRLLLPRLLGRYPDRRLIGLASLLMAAAFGLLLLSVTLPVFLAAQLCHGSARAIFWTSSQTHVVRSPGQTVRRLVDLNVVGNAGSLSGPAIGGSLAALGFGLSLGAACIAALIGAAASLLLVRYPPYDRRRSAGTWSLLRRDGVDVACWASVSGGAWWSMAGSFIPVILVGAGLGPIGIGWLITASEGAGMIALLTLRRLTDARVAPVVWTGAFVVLAALVAVAVAPARIELYALLMVIGGAASGTVTTLGPAMASLTAGPEEQGDALSLTGMFRAASLFGSPAAVGAMLAILPVAGAIVVVAGGLVVPGALLAGRTIREGRTPGRR